MKPDFSIVFVPDTQTLAESQPALLQAQADWIVSTRGSHNTAVVLNAGDMVDDVGDSVQWDRIDTYYDTLDAANIPYIATIGNHDVDSFLTRGAETTFNTYFPTTRYTGKSWWAGGFYEAGQSQNAYLNLGNYLYLSLEFGPRQVIIDWAKTIIAANPTKSVIIITHSMEYDSGPRFTTTGDTHNAHDYYASDTHDGQEIWDELGKLYNNVMICLSGHHVGSHASRHTATGDGANTVESMFCNWQAASTNERRLLSFYGKNVHVRTYSSALGQIMDADNDFWLTLP